MAVRVEDAGFEIRDMIAWVYGSGFPKSLDVSKAIDKAAGAEREVIGAKVYADGNGHAPSGIYYTDEKPIPQSGAPRNITAPATEAARQWEGYGTALKPAMEPILVARKPLDGTVAANVMAHGTGALNIDGCRIAAQAGDYDHPGNTTDFSDTSKVYGWATSQGKFKQSPPSPNGRWPANLIHDGSEEVVALFPVTTSGILKAGTKRTTAGGYHGGFPEIATHYDQGGDHGSAARFFYTAKASKKDREEENIHPTVKPTDLMRYLVRLVTPPGGVVLDPFTGSGSTGKAAMLEGFRFIGIEREAAYFVIACQRLDDAQRQGRLDLELPA
jgi:site-specific DNA-methyltransferase (adenine-specific)